jgi:hypothetical protein
MLCFLWSVELEESGVLEKVGGVGNIFVSMVNEFD